MTMKRDAKEAMLKTNIAYLIGERKLPSPGPRRIAEFGRFAPNDWAARFMVSYLRDARRMTREDAAMERVQGRRRITRMARKF